jgi:hypothetical protein
MVYSDKYKFIYYAIPKTGSRSIQSHLIKYGVGCITGWKFNHDNYEEVKKRIGKERSDNYLKFSFFRDPRSLLISIFFFNRHQWNYPPNKTAVLEWLHHYRGGDPYSPYIFDKEGNVVLDFIGRLEYLNEDLKTVCEKIGIPIPEKVPHIGAQNVKGRVSCEEYYEEPGLLRKIREIFSNSLRVLDYDL